MSALTPGCGSNSEARKRAAEAANPHAGCVTGTCKAGDQWRSVSCAGGGGDVEAIVWAAFDAAVKAAAPDDPTGHLPNCGYINVEHESCACPEYGARLRVGLREAITAALAAQPAAPQPTEDCCEFIDLCPQSSDVSCREQARRAAAQAAEGGALTEAERDAVRRCPDCGHDWSGHNDDEQLAPWFTCDGKRGLGSVSGCKCRLTQVGAVEHILAARSQRPEASGADWTREDHDARTDRLKPLAEHLRVGHDVVPEDRRILDTWLHIALLADEWFAAQRPEGVTVTEWGVQKRSYPLGTGFRLYGHDEENARRAAPLVIGDGAYVISRQRTTFPDVVTEWAEVSGDTEAPPEQTKWECGPHTNSWGGHDARCRRVPVAPGDTEAGEGRG